MTLPQDPGTVPNAPEMALFSAVFHRLTVACALTRMHDGLLVDVNAAWVALTGYARHEALAKTTVALGLWQGCTKWDAAMAPLLAGDSSATLEEVLTTKAGANRSVRIAANRFFDFR